MRIELPSIAPNGEHNWIDVRERLMAADKMAVQEAVKFSMSVGQGTQEISAGVALQMKVAFLARIITAWSFEGIPVPSTGLGTPADVLGNTLDIDDFNELEKQTDDLFAKVRNSSSPN